MKTPPSLGLCSLLLAAATLGACANHPLAVPPDLAQDSTQLPVAKVDRRTMTFGDYQVQNIRRGWEHGGSVSVGSVSASQKKRDFSFLLTHGDAAVNVTCGLKGSATNVSAFTVDSSEQVLCDLSTGAAPWSLVLVGEGDRSVRGQLRQGDREIQIQPAHGGGLMPPRGYFIREGQEVAAVDVGRKTRKVYLRNGQADDVTLALAAASTALMIYEEVASSS